ncbi:MAG TPA: helix-turn-helix domain-containing protein [bacterium]|nr:helix-turn-helix domain-containing protein [bacterium]
MTKALAPQSRWILPSEAARIIGVSPGYVRSLVDAGRLKAKRGPLGVRLIDRSAVVAFAQERPQKREVSRA